MCSYFLIFHRPYPVENADDLAEQLISEVKRQVEDLETPSITPVDIEERGYEERRVRERSPEPRYSRERPPEQRYRRERSPEDRYRRTRERSLSPEHRHRASRSPEEPTRQRSPSPKPAYHYASDSDFSSEEE